jgi:hypothetical protein
MQWDTQPVYMEELGDLPSQFQTFPTEWNTLHFGLAVDISGTEGAFFNQYSSWVAVELLGAGPWVFWALSYEFTRTIGALELDRVCQTTRVFDAVRVCSFTLHQDIAT